LRETLSSRYRARSPIGYLRDVIGRIADHPVNSVAELLPWVYPRQTKSG
jgi:hypothetical protein